MTDQVFMSFATFLNRGLIVWKQVEDKLCLPQQVSALPTGPAQRPYYHVENCSQVCLPDRSGSQLGG